MDTKEISKTRSYKEIMASITFSYISRMLGYNDLRSTQIYGKIAEDMQNLETKLKGKYNPAI